VFWWGFTPEVGVVNDQKTLGELGEKSALNGRDFKRQVRVLTKITKVTKLTTRLASFVKHHRVFTLMILSILY
jgi:hypothetical protein